MPWPALLVAVDQQPRAAVFEAHVDAVGGADGDRPFLALGAAPVEAAAERAVGDGLANAISAAIGVCGVCGEVQLGARARTSGRGRSGWRSRKR